MESIQDQATALNVWHIKDAKTIGINWVKGSMPEWKEKTYSIPKLYVVKESGRFSCRGFRCLNVGFFLLKIVVFVFLGTVV